MARHAFAASIAFLLSVSLALAVPAILSDQGTGVTLNGDRVDTADLRITLFTTPTGGSPFVDVTFVDAIINGTWNVILNDSVLTTLQYGKKYYKDYAIDGTDLDFGGDERLAFYSPLGIIDNQTLVNSSLVCGWAVEGSNATINKTLNVSSPNPQNQRATINLGSAGIAVKGSDSNDDLGSVGSVCEALQPSSCVQFSNSDININAVNDLDLSAGNAITITTDTNINSKATFNNPVIINNQLNISGNGVIQFEPRGTPDPGSNLEAEGNLFYNTDAHAFCFYNGTNWTLFDGTNCPGAVE